MLPLVDIPLLVSHYATHFQGLFTDSDYIHFQKYLSGLLVSDNKTVSGINDLFVLATQNQSSLNRFLNNDTTNLRELNEKRLNFLQGNAHTAFKSGGRYGHGGVLSLDDTMLCHYGREFEGISKLYDHANNTYVWAHNLLNLYYSDDQTAYPVSFELWEPADLSVLLDSLLASGVKIKPEKLLLKEQAPKKWKQHLLYQYKKHQRVPLVKSAYRSKIIMAEDLLSDFFSQYDLDLPISFDKWFTHPTFCRFIATDLQKAYVGGIKSNVELLMGGSKKVKLSDFIERLQKEHLLAQQNNQPGVFEKTTIKYKGKKEVYYNYCKTHHICGYGRQKLLISFQKADASDTARTFISNQLHWRSQHLTRVGRHRWPVEEYHKEGKAEGLNQYQVRNKKAVKKHIALVAVVYSLLQHAQHDDVLLNKLQRQLNISIEGSLAFWRRVTKAQALWMLVQWLDLITKRGWSLQRIMDTLVPAFGIT